MIIGIITFDPFVRVQLHYKGIFYENFASKYFKIDRKYDRKLLEGKRVKQRIDKLLDPRGFSQSRIIVISGNSPVSKIRAKYANRLAIDLLAECELLTDRARARSCSVSAVNLLSVLLDFSAPIDRFYH